MLSEYVLPAIGTFYWDKELKQPVLLGQLEIYDNELRVKILKQLCKNGDSFNVKELYAQFRHKSELQNKTNYTFFYCNPYRDYKKDEELLNFSSFTKNKDFVNEQNQGFIELDTTYTKISFEIENLEDWLWNQPFSNNMEHSAIKYRRKNGSYINYYNEKGSFIDDISQIEIQAQTIHRKINLSKYTSIIIHSTPTVFRSHQSDYKIEKNSRIDIITIKPKPINFFYYIIYQLCVYFTLIGVHKCKVKRIYDWKYCEYLKEFYTKNIPFTITTGKHNDWFSRYGMTYNKINKDIDRSMMLFFSKRKLLHNIMQFIADMNEIYSKEYAEVYLTQQIQMLETYGNIKLKGNYKKNHNGRIEPSENVQDIEKIIYSLPNKVFDKIFIHNYPKNDFQGFEIFGYTDKNKSIKELKIKLRIILTAIRNSSIHPYRNGKLKKINIPNHSLINSLSMLLRYLIYKEIGLKNYFVL